MLKALFKWLDSLRPRTFYALVFQTATSHSTQTHSLYYGFKGRQLNLSLEQLAQIKKENGVDPNSVFLSAFPFGRMRHADMTRNAAKWPYLDSDWEDANLPASEVSLASPSDWAEFSRLREAVLGNPFKLADYPSRRKLAAYISELEELHFDLVGQKRLEKMLVASPELPCTDGVSGD